MAGSRQHHARLLGWVTDLCLDLADRGALHKAISLENDVHIIEETQLFQDMEPVQTLLLSSKQVKCLHGWAGWPSRGLKPR